MYGEPSRSDDKPVKGKEQHDSDYCSAGSASLVQLMGEWVGAYNQLQMRKNKTRGGNDTTPFFRKLEASLAEAEISQESQETGLESPCNPADGCRRWPSRRIYFLP